MHKPRHPRKKEALEARLLKPSLSGNSLQYDGASAGKKLDLDAPLLSGRKNRAAPETLEANASISARVGRSGSYLGSLSRRPLVPFFTWEQHQAIVPAAEQSRVKNKDEAPHTTGLVLAPPPRQQQQQQQQFIISRQRDGKAVDCSDARSEFAYTEHASVAPTYVVSNLEVNDEDEDEPASAITEYNAADREMIMQRFLPAAKAVAIEMSSSIEDDSWRPVILHPSPQVHYRRPKVEHVEKVEKKSFGDFLSVQQETTSSSVDVDNGGRGVDRSCSSHFISDTACGFFPLLRMLQTSTSGCKQYRHDDKAQCILDDSADKSSGEEEWFSDQGGEEENYERLQAAYMACKYTPSRGGLKSPAIAESKGFLGMPRDRAGRTYIKRMYPVAETVTRRQQENSDADSVSSESLSSIRLDKRSDANSRQSSNGGGPASEKVFCLDTLNQVRQGATEQKKSFFIGGEETIITVVDERSDHPNAVEEAASPVLYRNSKQKTKKKQQLKERMMETLKHRRILRGSEEVEDSYYEDEEEEDEDELEVPSELRLCWHEEEQHKVLLPTPRGPAQSWLKKKLVQAQRAELANAALRKPPLARKPASAISFERQRF